MENIEKENNDDLLSQNYNEMTEIGKEKLKEISENVLNIWKVVNEKESES